MISTDADGLPIGKCDIIDILSHDVGEPDNRGEAAVRCVNPVTHNQVFIHRPTGLEPAGHRNRKQS